MPKKSHFFKAPPNPQLGNHICATCGLPFNSNRPNAKYCSEECRKKATKEYLAKWYQDHKREHNIKRQARRHNRGVKTQAEFFRNLKSKKKRNRVIKQELIYLELMTYQIKSTRKYTDLHFVSGRRKHDYKKCEFIRQELHKLGLFEEEILENDRYKIDYSGEYTGRFL